MRGLLDSILRFSIANRGVVIAVSIVFLVLGYFATRRLSVDVLPDLTKPTVTILTETHGLTPEEVEIQITRPIELSLLAAPGVTRVRSTSGMGMSAIVVEFEWDTDVYRNRQIVQERLQLARSSLPSGVLPTLGPIASLLGQIQVLGLQSDDPDVDPLELRTWADRVLRLRLLAVDGVAQVLVMGSAPRELLVEVDQEKLIAFEIDLSSVAEAIRTADRTASGGLLDAGSTSSFVRVTGRLEDAKEELGRIVLRKNGHGATMTGPVELRDVATLRVAPASNRVGDAGVNGGPGCLIVIQKQPEADTLDVSRRVENVIAQLEPTKPASYRIDPAIFRQADFVERAVDNVMDAVRDGAILVVLVLVLFLMNVRTTLITLTAIPMSIALTAIVFAMFGMSINTMTLGGLAVAIGALVDDAIVDVENVFRRLKQNRAHASPDPVYSVVLRASREVRRPIILGTIVVMAVYLPLFALEGMEGRLFTPIGIAYVVSILASLVVALTLTPALCALLLPNAGALERPKSRAVRLAESAAEACIHASIRYTRGFLSVLLGLAVCAVFVLVTRGSEFLPPFNEGSAQVNLFLPPGTSLTTANEYGKRLEKAVLAVEGVASVGRRTGRAQGDEHAMGIETTEMLVSFDPESPRNRLEMLSEIRHVVEDEFPGIGSEVEQPLAHLLSHLLSGVAAQVAIKIRGPDLATLRNIGEDIHARIEKVPGVVNANVEALTLVDEVWIRPDRKRLARQGIDLAEFADTVEAGLAGEAMGTWFIDEMTIPIVMRLRHEDRADMKRLGDVLLRSDPPLRVRDVSSVEHLAGANRIERENARRRLVVRHNVEGRSLGETVRDVEVILDGVRKTLPEGYVIDLEGQFEAERRASRLLFVLSLVAFAIMAALIWQHYRSWNLTAQVFLNLPTAFVGAVLAIDLTGQNISIATLVGLISLGGIAVRNKILLIDHYLELHTDEHVDFGPELIVRAGKERIVPVLMTALTTGVALLPLFLAGGEPGRELLYPVATVIIGGILTTTLLDLLLTPGVFHAFPPEDRRDAARHGNSNIDD
ncbi:MAG: efflux RND transporter permease subunit [Planctomycetes bacterium]|nr:efflux RND transporter permease subunit [Planctomycetota bacterium]